jgi:hypothetical protein
VSFLEVGKCIKGMELTDIIEARRWRAGLVLRRALILRWITSGLFFLSWH